MEHNHVILFNNIKLRPVKEDDLEKLRCWRNSIETPYLSRIPYITETMQREWFSKSLLNENEMLFAIEETEELDDLVGSLSLYNIENGVAEFGKILIGDGRAHGRKVGYNSVRAIVDFAFDKLCLKQIYLHVNINNIPAYHIYSEIGFRGIEGTAKNEEIEMSITREEGL